ncbi:hypothetical protein C7M84_009184 [Penaeus vannamei]|uniref:Mutator-like transposase domain-containing protein n=1 Tax=Penaeus vannamei TaxID=6689 RepID=A0A3R7PHV4_PENVA|nr:hypothetical protein C7M84_009184 [Penaeus vannamei]
MSPVASTSWARSPSPSYLSSPSRSPEAASGSDSSSNDIPPVSSGSRQSQDLDLRLSPEGSPSSAGSVANEGDADDAHGLARMTSLRKRLFSGIPECGTVDPRAAASRLTDSMFADLLEGVCCNVCMGRVQLVRSTVDSISVFTLNCRTCGEVSRTSPETFPLTDTIRGDVLTAMLVYCSLVNDDDYADIIVSFDCVWETRGHRSHIGLAFIVEANTGAILDKQVLCNLCSVCERKRRSLPANDYANWLLSHTHNSKNLYGPAGRMEAEAAQRMFLRSTDFGLRYAYFVGDGDSSAYRSVRFIYGPDREVVKYECVNHVGKRMGTRLRKLKGTLTTPVTTRTGCSLLARTLSNKSIDLLSRFYTLALERSVNTSLKTMRKNAIAPFYH